MKKIILVAFILFAALLPHLKVYATERANPVFDDRSWKLGWSQNSGG
jgi:hypothetical protein